MTAITSTASRCRPGTHVLLVAGIVLAALTEAIASTVLGLGRGDIIGATHATPDEFAWLDIGYTTLKLVGFVAAPWLTSRFEPRLVVFAATLAMGAACGMAAMTPRLDLLVALRAIQGLMGGILLVGGQALLFLAFPPSRQPLVQALFAMGSVVAPATIAPAFQGWLIDNEDWTWIFLGVVPVALAAAGLLLQSESPEAGADSKGPFDWLGFSLISAALFCFTYVLGQGSRWDWFEEPHILWLTVAGTAALLAFMGQQLMQERRHLIYFAAFRTEDFAFAFMVSFVAGAALFGSAYLIPAFAVAVLGFTPTDAGLLLLPSGAFFVGALLVAAYLMQARSLPPIATVPIGILAIMTAMWMLSGSSGESGVHDMAGPLLLRGLGLGFLFLSITLIAFSRLDRRTLASGIALFNLGRQLGGLIGVAALQTMIERETAANAAVLGAGLSPGVPAVSDRLAATAAMLVAGGLDPASAARAAAALLGRVVGGQSVLIAFNSAFAAVALLFIVAAPMLIAIKVGLVRFSKRRVTRRPSGSPGRSSVAASAVTVRRGDERMVTPTGFEPVAY